MECLQVEEVVYNNNHNNTAAGSMIDKCKELLLINTNFWVSSVRQQANRVAHSLARASRSYASHPFFFYLPPCIETIM